MEGIKYKMKCILPLEMNRKCGKGKAGEDLGKIPDYISIEMQRSQQCRGKRENESLVEDSPNYRVMVDNQE